jgi:hypothetical protein
MSGQGLLPNTTSAPALGLPPMPAVASGGDIYNARMDSLKALMQAGNGSLKGGSGKYRKYKTKITGRVKLRRNNVTKVMKGCSNKKTSKRGGAGGISPASQIEVPIPGGSSTTQVNTLASLSDGLLKLQQQAANVAPASPPLVKTMFSGGGGRGGKRGHRKTNRKTNKRYRRLRYKKSIGRKGRSRRHR